MRVIHEFAPGCYVTRAANALVVMAAATGEKQEGIFNGRPMVAEWNSTVDQVLDAWHESKTDEVA